MNAGNVYTLNTFIDGMPDFFFNIFFSNLLVNAGLPIVHRGAVFLLGCVVAQKCRY